jgi:hypothetical protein
METLALRPFYRGCIIATRGYDFWEGQVLDQMTRVLQSYERRDVAEALTEINLMAHARGWGHSCRRAQIIEDVVVSSRVYRESPCNGGGEHSRRLGRL